jgi:capsular exopolysaccharide synthesis family protein
MPRTDSVIEIAWRRKALLAGVFFLTVMAAAVALMVIPKRHTAQTRVIVERNVPNAGDAKNADLTVFLNTQIEIIRSATVLEPAMDGPGVAEASVIPRGENEVNFLKRNIDVALKPNTNVLQLQFAATNPAEAQAIIDSVAKAYVSHIAAQSNNVAMGDFEALREQRKHLDDERLGAQSLLTQLKNETTGAGDDPAVNAALARVTELSKAVSTAELETVRVRSEFTEALRGLGWSVDKYDAAKLAGATAVAPQSMDLLRGNLAGLSQQLIEAKRQFVPTHPAVRTIQAQLKDLQLSQAATLRGMYAAATDREETVRRQLNEGNERVQGLNKKAAELASITQRVESLNKQVALLDEKLSQMTLVESVGITARQLDPATIVENSAVPNTWKTLGIASIIGLVLGMMAALVREWVSPALGSVHRLADTVGVPLLGTLPRVNAAGLRELALTTHEQSDSAAAEAFRSIRTSLLFGAGNCETITVTSPAAKDGKTTLATNLAISLAQSGKRVVLVDANFRDPTLHEIFKTDNGIGFSGVLNGDDLESSLRRTPIEHLDLLTAGPRTPDISEQLNSDRFGDLLRDLHLRYDHAIFDAAPVSGSNDARVIAAGCDQTVLVVRGEKSNRFAVATARDALLSVGATLMGIVVNDAAAAAYPAGGERRPGPTGDRTSTSEQFARLRSGR